MLVISPNVKETVESVYNLTGLPFDLYQVPREIKTKSKKEEVIQDFVAKYKDNPPNVILCGAGGELFKALTGAKKVSGLEGYPCDCKYLPSKVFYIPSVTSFLFNPEFKKDIAFAVDKVKEYLKTGSITLGNSILTNAKYIHTPEEFKQVLPELLSKPALAIDIETAGYMPLKHYDNYIYSIAFAWNDHEGIAVRIDAEDEMLAILRTFFEQYKGCSIYHNSGFDIQNLVYHLFMKDLKDYKGLVDGVQIMCKNFEDTKLIAYLVLNSCSGDKSKYSLKKLAHEYAGNYAQEDIANIGKSSSDINRWLRYNLTDSCATFWVFNKYYKQMVEENQEDIYRGLFLPTQKVLIETQLVGLRLAPQKVQELDDLLNTTKDSLFGKIQTTRVVKQFNEDRKQKITEEYNKKVKNPKDFEYISQLSGYKDKEKFNPESHQQVAELLYKYLNLPVIDTTDTGNPSIKKETLEKLINYCDTDEKKELLQALVDYSGIAIILNTFMPNFTDAPLVDNKKVLYGSFNLGGTLSGRLSSSEPNLQNLPSTGTRWAKPIKELFQAPEGFVFVGSDFSSLRIILGE